MLTTAVLAASLVLGVLGVASPSAADDPRPPSVTVTPSSGLLDGHPVQVSAAGLVPGASYALLDCAAAGCVPEQPYYMTVSTQATPLSERYDPRRFVQADAQGTVRASLRVARQIQVGAWDPDDDGQPGPDTTTQVDCTAGGCAIGIVPRPIDDTVTPVPVASAPIGFAATGAYQWTPGTLSANPTERLTDQETVRVTGAGWDPGAYEYNPIVSRDKTYGARVEICATGPSAPEKPCQLLGWPLATVDHDGTVDAEVQVDRFIDVGTAEAWDCAVSPCALRMGQTGGLAGRGAGYSTPVPVQFGPEWAPFASPTHMVDRLAVAITGAELPAAERTTPIQGLTDGVMTAPELLWGLGSRPGATGDVATLYAGVLGRRPDTGGLAFWVPRHRSGAITAARLAQQFAGTPEVRAWHQRLSDAQAVDQVYQRVLGRAADAGGRAYWVAKLAGGMSRPRLIASFALSPEGRSRQRLRGATTAITFGIFGRAPTAQEWTAYPMGDPTREGLLRQVLGSPEVAALAD